MSTTNPPFRADHVGSLLRPAPLLAARERYFKGELPKAELRQIEDEQIAAVVKKQEAIGLQSITDGEFRRTFFHLDFLEQLAGVSVTGAIAASSDAGEKVHFTPPKLSVTGKLRHTRNIQVDDFNYLKTQVRQTPKDPSGYNDNLRRRARRSHPGNIGPGLQKMDRDRGRK